MLKVENIEVAGLEPAIRGMRNPMNSWKNSDSTGVEVGENDLLLMNSLFKSGTEHRKYDRMITVWMDITAPLYFWKEYDTYKVGTVANSCSTMHKIHAKEFTMDDFSYEHLQQPMLEILKHTIHGLNDSRDAYLSSKDKLMWWQMIQLLPSSYNQKRTVMMNYEVCARIIEQRSNHKLDEWHTLCDVIHTLPYFDEITGE